MIKLPLPQQSVKCPHCLVTVYVQWGEYHFDNEGSARWLVRSMTCPACDRVVVRLLKQPVPDVRSPLTRRTPPPEVDMMVWPKAVARAPIPPSVPKALADHYTNASKVLADSPEASAALSRRCLQNLLIEKAGVKSKDLFDQIQEVLDSKVLPSRLADDLDAVRAVGNFGAHPIKSQATGQIVEVEPGEAEWNLDVLEGLFDFYFVEPEKQKKRRDALNAKLKEAGKPPLR